MPAGQYVTDLRKKRGETPGYQGDQDDAFLRRAPMAALGSALENEGMSMIDTTLSPEERQRQALREAFGDDVEERAHLEAGARGQQLSGFADVADFVADSSDIGDRAPRDFDPFR